MLVQIPLQAIPNQEFTITLNNQQTNLNFYQQGDWVFANFYLGKQLIIGGAICENLAYINQYPTSFNGYLFFYSLNQTDPNWTNLGTTSLLFYSDYDALEDDYQAWVKANA